MLDDRTHVTLTGTAKSDGTQSEPAPTRMTCRDYKSQQKSGVEKTNLMTKSFEETPHPHDESA